MVGNRMVGNQSSLQNNPPKMKYPILIQIKSHIESLMIPDTPCMERANQKCGWY